MAHDMQNANSTIRDANRGVTLIEMLIVVGVIAILASMIIAVASRVDNQGKERNLQATFLQLENALQEYYDNKGSFPDLFIIRDRQTPYYDAYSDIAIIYDQLYSLPDSRKMLEKINTSFIKNNINMNNALEVYDPWGTVLGYFYITGDNFPVITSAGPDKNFNTGTDNITNR